MDRQEFVQAGSLEIGERLQTLSGDVKVVQQKLPRPGPQPVFNLEVHNEHVYFVGQDGVLVHNSCNEWNDFLTANKGKFTGDDWLEQASLAYWSQKGLSVRSDLPQHLISDGFHGNKLSGTHNRANAIAAINSRGGTFIEKASTTAGISELSYQVPKATGGFSSGLKTVYDPAIFSDTFMTQNALYAARRMWRDFMKDTSVMRRDYSVRGVKMRAYINTDGRNHWVGNSHPIQ